MTDSPPSMLPPTPGRDPARLRLLARLSREQEKGRRLQRELFMLRTELNQVKARLLRALRGK
jgi:hypothetical protein